MTFIEAAIEVLRLVRQPLHYRRITEIAVNRQLLSHVGRTPEVVMASRLIREAQNESADSKIIRLTQGIFALSEWPEAILENFNLEECGSFEEQMPDQQDGMRFSEVPFALEDNVDRLPLVPEVDTLSGELESVGPMVRMEDEGQAFSPVVQQEMDIDEEISEEYVIDDNWKGTVQPEPNMDYIRNELNAPHNEHYNVCAAIVKVLREHSVPVSAQELARVLTHRFGLRIFTQNVVMAMRADNALRSARGKRSIFTNIHDDFWTLTENDFTRHVLKLESRVYDMARQLRLYSLQALTQKLRELSPLSWLQLSAILLKHLGYTIVSQVLDTETEFILRADEQRGVTFIPVLIKVIYAETVSAEDVIRLKDMIAELHLDHGLLLTNGDFSRDAVHECAHSNGNIYAYSAKQIAPIMLDAKIGILTNCLPLNFIDNEFFISLSRHEKDS